MKEESKVIIRKEIQEYQNGFEKGNEYPWVMAFDPELFQKSIPATAKLGEDFDFTIGNCTVKVDNRGVISFVIDGIIYQCFTHYFVDDNDMSDNLDTYDLYFDPPAYTQMGAKMLPISFCPQELQYYLYDSMYPLTKPVILDGFTPQLEVMNKGYYYVDTDGSAEGFVSDEKLVVNFYETTESGPFGLNYESVNSFKEYMRKINESEFLKQQEKNKVKIFIWED